MNTQYRIAERLLTFDEARELTLAYGEARVITKIDPDHTPALDYLRGAIAALNEYRSDSSVRGFRDRWKTLYDELSRDNWTRKDTEGLQEPSYGQAIPSYFAVLQAGPLCLQAISGNNWYAVIGWPYPGDTLPVRCWGRLTTFDESKALLWVRPSFGYSNQDHIRIASFNVALALRGLFQSILNSVDQY
jgi:hypothetical protein